MLWQHLTISAIETGENIVKIRAVKHEIQAQAHSWRSGAGTFWFYMLSVMHGKVSEAGWTPALLGHTVLPHRVVPIEKLNAPSSDKISSFFS